MTDRLGVRRLWFPVAVVAVAAAAITGLWAWPDPDFGTYPGSGYGIELTERFDINSPEVQAAGGACQEEGRGFFEDLEEG